MRKFLLTCFALAVALHSFAQERTVSGTVTSTEDGSPLPGVNVIVKGTTSGTATDSDGKFAIGLPATGGSLVFSFIGLESKEITVGDRSIVDVSLALDVTQLSEVVVTALGLERESKTLGFSVKEIKNEELTVGRTTNVVNALSGKVAGVRVAGSNGMTGASSAIFIRGMTTFTGSNQPLFVVDGIPIDNGGGAMATQTGVSQSNRAIDLNQDDIESMTVLKGPAAAALYGSRAASGAIIITTKTGKGKRGSKNTVEYTGSYNITEPNRLPDYQNRYASGTSLSTTGVPIAPVFDATADQSNWGPEIAGQLVPSAYSPADQLLFGLPANVPLTAYPDNVKDLFQKGYNSQNNLAFSGSSEKSNFFLSYNNLQDKGFLEGNRLERNSFRFTGNTQLTERFNMGISFNYINSESKRSQTGNQLANPLFRGWFIPRNYDLQGDPYIRPDGSQVYFNANTDNPYWTLKNNKWSDELNRIIGNINMAYDFNSWLSASFKIGTDAFIQRIKTYDAPGSRGQVNHNVGGVGAIGDRMIYNQQTSSYLTFLAKKDIGKIKLNALVGNEINLRVGQDNGFYGNTLNTFGFDNINDANNFVPIAGTRFRRNLVGFFADIQANYNNWIYLGFTGRNDISSTFRKGKNSYFYPSVTSSFILTEAVPALKSEVLNFAKIKANWARVGREADIYSTDTYYATANPSDGFGPQILFPFLGRLGRTLGNTAGNADLTPEFTNSFEVGAEVGLFNDRIRLDVTYFKTRSTDIILDVPVAAASGFTTQAKNAGTLESNGFEVSVSATPVKAGDFTWSIDANWAHVESDVIELAPGVLNIGIGGFTTATTRIEAGKPYGVLYANTLLRNDQGQLVVNATTGLPILDSRGLQFVGNPNPQWTAGITNTFSFKGISASFLFDFRYGGDILSRVINDVRRTGSVVETADKERFDADGLPIRDYVVDGVHPDGTPNTIAITAQEYWSNMYSFNAPGMGVFDASWVRLREASIFYSLPKSLIEKTPFGKVEIGVNGRNLALWTDVPHIDPETNLLGASNSQGLEFNTMPNARTYGAVLKFTF
jgi:TonB-linked SusC/RagA family outer membrane protein